MPALLPLAPVVPAKKTMVEVALKAAEARTKLKADAEKAVSEVQDADRDLKAHQSELILTKAELATKEASVKSEFNTKLAKAEADLKKATDSQTIVALTAALKKVRDDEKKAKDALKKQKVDLKVEEAKIAAEVKRVDALKLSAENATKLALGKGKTRRFGKKANVSENA
jgi:hypothetical protein